MKTVMIIKNAKLFKKYDGNRIEHPIADVERDNRPA